MLFVIIADSNPSHFSQRDDHGQPSAAYFVRCQENLIWRRGGRTWWLVSLENGRILTLFGLFCKMDERVATPLPVVAPWRTWVYSVHRINLRIEHEVAGSIAGLRAAMEALVVEVTKDPEYIRSIDPTNERLLNAIRLLSRPSSAGLNLMTSNPRWVSHTLEHCLPSCLIFENKFIQTTERIVNGDKECILVQKWHICERMYLL